MNYLDNYKNCMKAIEEAKLRALETIGLFVEGETKSICPVGETGNLRNSYNHKVVNSESKVVVGSNVEYAPYVELGTSRQKAQPHLNVAFRTNEDNIKKIIEKEYSKV